MFRKSLLHSMAALALFTGAAAAQQVGGLAVAGPGFGQLPVSQQPQSGAAGPLAQAPADLKSVNPARANQDRRKQAIVRIRGDAGYLAGFHAGQPLAASVQPPPELGPIPMPDMTFIDAPFIINNQNSVVSLAVGEGNNSQQSVAAGPADALPAAPGAAGSGIPTGRPAHGALAQQANALAAAAASSAVPLAAGLAAASPTPIVNSVDSIVNMAAGAGNTARQRVQIGR